jgi:uncharacterized protein (DUF488 family)
MNGAHPEILTIGHSTHPIEKFVALLKAHRVESLVDVRSFPGSRRHPQFNQAALADALRHAGVAYYHMVSLGGRRKATEGPEQGAVRVAPFAAYGDYAKTAPFRDAVSALEILARQSRVAIMCAEADWRHCHRQFIAEALTSDGFAVTHILPDAMARARDRAPELPGL